MSNMPNCPQCQSTYVYEDRGLFICPECAYEWSTKNEEASPIDTNVIDANGNTLQDGDTVSVIKDLKIKGSSSVVKVGTKVKNIRLIDSLDNAGHNIDCKITGIGAMKLKSEFVKKA